jgi:hypothetical protein
MPIDRQKLLVHAPPAQTTVDAATRPRALAQPLFEFGELRVVFCQVERSTLPEADVTEFFAQFQPQLQAAHHQGKFDR